MRAYDRKLYRQAYVVKLYRVATSRHLLPKLYLFSIQIRFFFCPPYAIIQTSNEGRKEELKR